MVEVNKEKHIHTLEYFSSSKLCDSVVKHGQSVQVLQNPKTFVNNSEENLPVSCGSGIDAETIYHKNYTPIPLPIKMSGLLGGML